MELLYLTYSLVNSIGIALTSASHILIIFKYFRRHRSLAQGVNVAGGALGIMTVPSIMQFLIDKIGWRNAYRIAAGMFGLLSLLSIMYSPYIRTDSSEVEVKDDDQLSKESKDIEADRNVTQTLEDTPGACDNYSCADVAHNDKIAKDNNLQLESISRNYKEDSQSADKNLTSNSKTDEQTSNQTTDQDKKTDVETQNTSNHNDDILEENNDHQITSTAHVHLESTADHKSHTSENDEDKYTVDQNDLSTKLQNRECANARQNPSFVNESDEHISFEHDNINHTAGQETNQLKCNKTSDNEQEEDKNEDGENKGDRPKSARCFGLVDCSVWRNSRFVFAVVALSIATFAMFSPSVHLVSSRR